MFLLSKCKNILIAWTLSGFGIILNSNSDLETKSTVNILNPSSNQIASTENRDEVTSQKSNLGLFKLGSIYKPNSKFQLDYDILSKLSKQDENSSLLRQSIVNSISTNETIFTGKKQDPTSLNQILIICTSSLS